MKASIVSVSLSKSARLKHMSSDLIGVFRFFLLLLLLGLLCVLLLLFFFSLIILSVRWRVKEFILSIDKRLDGFPAILAGLLLVEVDEALGLLCFLFVFKGQLDLNSGIVLACRRSITMLCEVHMAHAWYSVGSCR